MNETLTKKRIYLESVKSGMAGFGLVFILITTLAIISIIVLGVVDGLGFFGTILRLLELVALLTGFLGFIILLCMITALPTIFLIKKQERYFGFNFNEEMKKHNIKSIDCQNNEWAFFETWRGCLRAVNYSYIESFTVERGRGGGVFIESIDGKGFRLALINEEIEKFRTWFNLER